MKFRTVKVHDIKTVNPYFTDTWNGNKPVEIRLDDRNYSISDILRQREFLPSGEFYTGREILSLVKYKIPAGKFEGLSNGYCLMVIEIIEKYEADLNSMYPGDE